MQKIYTIQKYLNERTNLEKLKNNLKMCKKYVEDIQNIFMLMKGHIAKDAQKYMIKICQKCKIWYICYKEQNDKLKYKRNKSTNGEKFKEN